MDSVEVPSHRRGAMWSALRRRLGHSDTAKDAYPYVYVEADGTARELHRGERTYLETDFLPGDGARPNIKWRYRERNGWGELSGYLKRSKLPRGTPILPAPETDPGAITREEFIAQLRERGANVTESPDGTFTVTNPGALRDQGPGGPAGRSDRTKTG